MMKKIILVVAVVIVILLVSIPLWIDGVAKSAIVDAGSAATGVETRLDSISLSILGDEHRFEGLFIGNPDGFDTPHFLNLGHATLHVSFGDLMEDDVVIPSIVVDGISLHLERKRGRSNYREILANINKGPKEEEKEEGSFVIKEILLRNISVRADTKLGVTIPLEIPEMRLRNVGAAGGGALLRQVLGDIITGLLRGVMKTGGGILPKDITKGLGEGLGELEKLGGELADVGKKAIGAGLKGLLGRKKKKDD